MDDRCFYCDVRLKNIPSRKDRVLGTRKPTRDHLVPRALFARYDMSQRQMSLNIVACCDLCNQRKGRMSPLVWMKTVDARVAERIRDRLVAMGLWGTLWEPADATPPPP